MKKRTIQILTLVTVSGISIWLTGRHGVKITSMPVVENKAFFVFVDEAGNNWKRIPVDGHAVDLGWSLIGRRGVITYRIEEGETTLAGGKVTIPRLGYARITIPSGTARAEQAGTSNGG